MSTPLPAIETKKCPHCAEEIKADAKKCKHCGEFLEKIEQPVESKCTPVKKMAYGKAILYCMGVGFIMVMIGLVACIFVIGMIIGIPLIIGGIGLFIASPIAALYVFEADCPYCGNHFNWLGNKKALKCRQCKQRSSLRGMRLEPLKTFVRS